MIYENSAVKAMGYSTNINPTSLSSAICFLIDMERTTGRKTLLKCYQMIEITEEEHDELDYEAELLSELEMDKGKLTSRIKEVSKLHQKYGPDAELLCNLDNDDEPLFYVKTTEMTDDFEYHGQEEFFRAIDYYVQPHMKMQLKQEALKAFPHKEFGKYNQYPIQGIVNFFYKNLEHLISLD